MVNSMLDVVNEFPGGIRIDSNKPIVLKIVTHFQFEWSVVIAAFDERSDPVDSRECDKFIGLNQFIMTALVVVDGACCKTLFEANEEFKRMAKMLAECALIERLGGFRKIILINVRDELFKLGQYVNTRLF
jgi:hypothetical protein